MANPPGPSLIETLTQEASGNLSFRLINRGKVAHQSDVWGATRNRHYRIIHLKAEGLIEQTVTEAKRLAELAPTPFD
ncbi:hypothetical protein OX90_19190 [Pseudomonas coronafaciens pv. porri]|uniref:Uncharacterized protein n=2 Tax=Pseudomonas coronafaciens TaxID=53409 RepID=A0ABR5JKE7_9PSED|nr:hypothetical protein [Pseudomonas coronafaciens]KOP54741.1 hypothetical protein OX90_19190 [Pseudomonas coronafaciens pv. porri]